MRRSTFATTRSSPAIAPEQLWALGAIQSLEHKRLHTPLLRCWPPWTRQQVQTLEHGIQESCVSHRRCPGAQYSSRNRRVLSLCARSLLVSPVVQLLLPNCARQQRVRLNPAQENGNRGKEQRPRLPHKRYFICATCTTGEADEIYTAAHAQARDHEAVAWEQGLRLRRSFCRQLHGTRVTTQHASYHTLVHQLVEGGEPVRRGRRTCRASLRGRRRHPDARHAEELCTVADTRHNRGTRGESEV